MLNYELREGGDFEQSTQVFNRGEFLQKTNKNKK